MEVQKVEPTQTLVCDRDHGAHIKGERSSEGQMPKSFIVAVFRKICLFGSISSDSKEDLALNSVPATAP